MGKNLYDRLMGTLQKDEKIESVMFSPQVCFYDDDTAGYHYSCSGYDAAKFMSFDGDENKIALSLEQATKYLQLWDTTNWQPNENTYMLTVYRYAMVWTNKKLLRIRQEAFKLSYSTQGWLNRFTIEAIPRNPQDAMNMWEYTQP